MTSVTWSYFCELDKQPHRWVGKAYWRRKGFEKSLSSSILEIIFIHVCLINLSWIYNPTLVHSSATQWIFRRNSKNRMIWSLRVEELMDESNMSRSNVNWRVSVSNACSVWITEREVQSQSQSNLKDFSFQCGSNTFLLLLSHHIDIAM